MNAWLIEVRGKRMTGGWTKWKPYYFGALTKKRAERFMEADTTNTQFRVRKYRRTK